METNKTIFMYKGKEVHRWNHIAPMKLNDELSIVDSDYIVVEISSIIGRVITKTVELLTEEDIVRII